MKQSILAAGCVLALATSLAACGDGETSLDINDAPPPPPPTVSVETDTVANDTVIAIAPAASQTVAVEIDWDAARNDMASSRSLMTEDAAVSIQSDTGQAPPVPVLLPTGIVSVQSVEGTGGPRFRPLDDGYFAAYPGAVYDVIVNGTNQLSDVDGKARTRNDDMVFTATAAGAQVSLSRYGADYLIEFECNEIDADTGTCVSEEDALAVAENLIVAGSR